jgi:hypothetical protein
VLTGYGDVASAIRALKSVASQGTPDVIEQDVVVDWFLPRHGWRVPTLVRSRTPDP